MASPQLWSRSSPLQSPLLPRWRPLRLPARPLTFSSRGLDPRASDGSYLSMWQKAKDRRELDQLRLYREEKEKELQAQQDDPKRVLEEQTQRFSSLLQVPSEERDRVQQRMQPQDNPERVLEEQTQRFSSLLQVPSEERDRVQRMQVVDRAAAALAAVNALLDEQSSFRNTAATLPPAYAQAVSEHRGKTLSPASEDSTEVSPTAHLTLGVQATPGPDFWTWTPPPYDVLTDTSSADGLQRLRADASPSKAVPIILEKDDSPSLDIPFESKENAELSLVFQRRAKPSLPPLQSLLEVKEEVPSPSEEETTLLPSLSIPEIGEDIASFLQQECLQDVNSDCKVNPDGSRWWKETGRELTKDGVTCSWTVIRGTNADGTEWEEKFWEAFDDLDYKELGAEKSGRDAAGNVWREFWKEAMWQDLSTGLLHMEKTADKWGKYGPANEWHEKWWEHYNASGHAEKWADKWCKIDESTILEPGHAHVWHERWGEKFDGQGSAIKYTDKWAERAMFGGGRSKWGDKWDENFDKYGHGVKQGETWWEGTSGERWNRTWGEKHNRSGWVHKYGKSSSGEHWDTHVQQDTWYEGQPHFGFNHCLENSRELQRVGTKRNNIQ